MSFLSILCTNIPRLLASLPRTVHFLRQLALYKSAGLPPLYVIRIPSLLALILHGSNVDAYSCRALRVTTSSAGLNLTGTKKNSDCISTVEG